MQITDTTGRRTGTLLEVKATGGAKVQWADRKIASWMWVWELSF
jgi:hypothetical protein